MTTEHFTLKDMAEAMNVTESRVETAANKVMAGFTLVGGTRVYTRGTAELIREKMLEISPPPEELPVEADGE